MENCVLHKEWDRSCVLIGNDVNILSEKNKMQASIGCTLLFVLNTHTHVCTHIYPHIHRHTHTQFIMDSLCHRRHKKETFAYFVHFKNGTIHRNHLLENNLKNELPVHFPVCLTRLCAPKKRKQALPFIICPGFSTINMCLTTTYKQQENSEIKYCL